MKKIYRLSPQFLFKQTQDNLLLVSLDSSVNEVYKFSGLSSELLKSLFDKQEFSFLQAEQILRSKKIEDNTNLDQLWAFCLEEKIISMVS